LTTGDNDIAISPPMSVEVGKWLLQPGYSYKGDSTRPLSHGIPNWQLGMKTSRDVGRLEFGIAGFATRGHRGPAFFSQELGTGKDLSADTPVIGPYSYKTIGDAIVMIGVRLKTRGRVQLKAVGEAWSAVRPTASGTELTSRAIRIGLAVTY
jgi:hypothetical protein